MAMNKIQFQKGLSLSSFLAGYGTDEACAAALFRMRWPGGFSCPGCSERSCRTFVRGHQRLYQCNSCGRQSSLLAGTILTKTKVPLSKWFLALYLLTQTKTNLAALELMRHLGVAYNTAWRMKHKLMEVMIGGESDTKLQGSVQIDDAYLGGELNGGKLGRGSENKIPIIVAVSTDDAGHPQQVVISPISGFTKSAIAEWTGRHLAPDCKVYTDGLRSFRVFEELGHRRTIIKATGREACRADGATWVNTVLGNIKRAIDGRYHAFDFTKYAQRYLSEAAWRFNRRFHLDSITTDLIFAVANSTPCPEGRLRHQFHGC